MGHLTEMEYFISQNNNQIDQTKELFKLDSNENLVPEPIDPVEILTILKDRIYRNLSSTISHFQSKEYKEVGELLESFAFYQVSQALFIDMGWVPELSETFTLAQFIDKHNLSRNFNKLVLTFLRRLAERGILREKVEENVFEVRSLPPTHEEIWNQLKTHQTNLMKYPGWAQEVSCIDYFGSHLYSVLSGKETGLKILFPYEKDTLRYPYAAKSLYENTNTMKLTKVLPTINGIQEHLKFLTNNNISGPIRILEIGAGTGGTTIPLLKSLPSEIFSKLEYTFTDISNFFIGQTKGIIQSQFSEEIMKCLEFRTLDIEMDPEEQGFEFGAYDLILAADVFHATEYLGDTLDHTRKLLKSNGLLVLGEVFESRLFIEISFGLTSGWWRWSDEERQHSSPLLTPSEWNHLLKEHGFLDSFSVGDDSYGIIFAQATANC